MTGHLAYPTAAHERAAGAITAFFAGRDSVDLVLQTNSCARGKATPDSCLDIAVIVAEGTPVAPLEAEWRAFHASEPAFAALAAAGAFSDVHLDIVDLRIAPPDHPEDEYPDDFEVLIGNYLVYAVPLWERGDRLRRLRAGWVPYYDDALRDERLARAIWCCRHHLDHIPLYVARGLWYQALDRLHLAFRCFLQALFIARRTYPIAYNKWLHEQVAGILGLPDLYRQLPPLFAISDILGTELNDKAAALHALADTYLGDRNARPSRARRTG